MKNEVITRAAREAGLGAVVGLVGGAAVAAAGVGVWLSLRKFGEGPSAVLRAVPVLVGAAGLTALGGAAGALVARALARRRARMAVPFGAAAGFGCALASAPVVAGVCLVLGLIDEYLLPPAPFGGDWKGFLVSYGLRPMLGVLWAGTTVGALWGVACGAAIAVGVALVRRRAAPALRSHWSLEAPRKAPRHHLGASGPEQATSLVGGGRGGAGGRKRSVTAGACGR
jgi:hypothetical protein